MSTQKEIQSLTKEQRAAIKWYVEDFRQIGMSVKPTNKRKAEKAVLDAYEYLAEIDHKPFNRKDIKFHWVTSPGKGAKKAAQFAKGNTKVTKEEIRKQADLVSTGSFEAHWVSTYAFIAEVVTPNEPQDLASIMRRIVEECGCYWTFENAVVMSPKPSRIVMKDGKLHNLKGPAIEYADGWSVYAINGKTFEKDEWVAAVKKFNKKGFFKSVFGKGN